MATPSTELWVCAGIAGRDDENWIALDKDFDTGVTKLLAEIKQRSVFHATDLSYIRVSPPEPIDVGAQYDTLLSATRIAFKNPGSTKWWFGCVDHVEYVNDGVTRIHWVEDIFNNWWGNRHNTMKYVVREHTNDDTIGANTEPENVELGPYITTATTKLTATVFGSAANICGIVMATESKPESVIVLQRTNPHPPGFYGGVFCPFWWYQCFPDNDGTLDNLYNLLSIYRLSGKADAIVGVYMQPHNLFAIDTSVNTTDTPRKDTPVKNQLFNLADRTMSYTPTNKKLYTYPYVCCVLSNLSDNVILQYELFSGAYVAHVVGGFGMDAYAFAAPEGYGGKRVDNTRGVQIGGWPLLSWTDDVFARWVAQNRGKTTASLLNTSIIGAARLFAGDVAGGIGTIATGVISTVGAVTDQRAMPDNSYGAKNAQNVLAVANQGEVSTVGDAPSVLGFYSFCQCIRPEYMQIIDDHFSRLGYATNKLKTPNFFGRKKFNFVQLANPSTRGAMPQYAKDYFDKCLSHGVTLWHDIAVGDYYGSNAIVTS
mgnify:CR=1 FL=1